MTKFEALLYFFAHCLRLFVFAAASKNVLTERRRGGSGGDSGSSGMWRFVG